MTHPRQVRVLVIPVTRKKYEKKIEANTLVAFDWPSPKNRIIFVMEDCEKFF